MFPSRFTPAFIQAACSDWPGLPEQLRRRRPTDGAGDLHPRGHVLEGLARWLVDVGAGLVATEGSGVGDLVPYQLRLLQGGKVPDDLHADPHVGRAEEVQTAHGASGTWRPLHQPRALLQRQACACSRSQEEVRRLLHPSRSFLPLRASPFTRLLPHLVSSSPCSQTLSTASTTSSIMSCLERTAAP
eukprot:745735-Hanusia_phi.AAC.3